MGSRRKEPRVLFGKSATFTLTPDPVMAGELRAAKEKIADLEKRLIAADTELMRLGGTVPLYAQLLDQARQFGHPVPIDRLIEWNKRATLKDLISAVVSLRTFVDRLPGKRVLDVELATNERAAKES